MNRKAFTLVELLAVIVILSVILIIAIPKILDVINTSKTESLVSSAKILAGQAEKKYIEKIADESLDQVNDPILCSDISKLSADDYDSCTIKIQNSKIFVDIVGKGKFTGKYICNATKELATVSDEDCSTYATTVAINSKDMLEDGTKDNNLRYSGSNPDNYVSFNGETWRIIGIFNVSNGTSIEQRVKIIRNVSIGSYSWDSSASDVNYGCGVNDWSLADLKTELNTIYYNKISGTCYNFLNNASVACDFSSNGLGSTAKSMIDNVVWNLGGTVYSNPSTAPYGLPTNDTYEKERGTTVYTGRPTTWTGIVGLMYASDYGYSSTDAGCRTNIRAGLTYNSGSYNSTNAKCKNNNWLYTGINSWTLTPNSGSSLAAFVADIGYIDGYGACTAFVVRPVVYLKPNVKITSGTGTSANPYILNI